jgi:hypothetical protein
MPAAEARDSMSGEESMPVILEPGKADARTAAELPGPQPRSKSFKGVELEEEECRCGATCDTRSWTARVRSVLNLRYWVADQSGVAEVDMILWGVVGWRKREFGLE